MWENWPTSGRRPSLSTLDKLARLYQVAAADLLTGVYDYRHLDQANHPDPPPATDPTGPGGTDRDPPRADHALLETLSHLTEQVALAALDNGDQALGAASAEYGIACAEAIARAFWGPTEVTSHTMHRALARIERFQALADQASPQPR